MTEVNDGVIRHTDSHGCDAVAGSSVDDVLELRQGGSHA